MSDERDEPARTDKPLHGERRPAVAPAFIVAGIIALIIVLFLLITVVQWNT